MNIFVVFQKGSDEPLLGIYATREAAEYAHDRDDQAFIVQYVLDEATQEFKAQE